MKRQMVYALLALGLAATACDDDDPSGPQAELFRATLTGAAEVPTPRITPATGVANFSLLNDVLTWTIDLTNITNVTAAHIHIGAATVSGGVILPLTPGTSGVNNTRITGSVSRTTFIAPGSPNQAVTFDGLLAMMRDGTSYVNVHTNLTTNDPTNNSGPGDFPAGEIRGQIGPR